ncbi:Hypothetical protein NocV09_02201170 [Nannochloropsis oceanica]
MLRVAFLKNLHSVVRTRPRHYQQTVHHASTTRSVWLCDPAVKLQLDIVDITGFLISTFIVYYSTTSPYIRFKVDRYHVVRVRV